MSQGFQQSPTFCLATLKVWGTLTTARKNEQFHLVVKIPMKVQHELLEGWGLLKENIE